MKRVNPFDNIPEDRTAVDNILRLNVTSQMRLTVMADQKANIMITVASIVFSVTVANLDNEVMKWPLLFLAFGSTVSLLCAIFAIIPKTDYPKKLGTDDIDRNSPQFNPLFFGHFSHLPIDEYKEDYAETLMTDDRIYDAIASDIYGIGTSLMKGKYRWLKRAYLSFLAGMGGAIFIFVLQSIQLDEMDSITIGRGIHEWICSLSISCR